MAKSSVFQQYAQIGAAVRVQELRAELAEIERAFPGLTRRDATRTARPSPSGGDAATVQKRTRKPMRAAQKRAVGIRMKAYWAAQRKTKAAAK